MERKIFECGACDAHGTIVYDLDSEYYSICTCPFCGAEISASEDDDE